MERQSNYRKLLRSSSRWVLTMLLVMLAPTVSRMKEKFALGINKVKKDYCVTEYLWKCKEIFALLLLSLYTALLSHKAAIHVKTYTLFTNVVKRYTV